MKNQAMTEFPGGGASCNPAPVRVLFKFILLGQFMSFVGDLFFINSSLIRYRFENKYPTNFFAKKQSKDETNFSRFTQNDPSPKSKMLYLSQNDTQSFCSAESQGEGMRVAAFTLAEVLITLGIIGIVAAMTLPALINNYNTKLTETRLKKFYSIFNQAILRSVNDNGPFEGWDYWVDEWNGNGLQIPNQSKINNAFEKYLRPYMNIVAVKKGKCAASAPASNGGKCYYYFLADGSAFTFSEHLSRTIWFYPKGDWERCEKANSNIKGRCCFTFLFQPFYDKDLDEWKYHLNKGLEPFMVSWDGTEDMLINDPSYGCAVNGIYCTALIQQNGWRVPKNYPHKIKY